MKTISQVPVLKQTQNSFRQADRIIYHNIMVYNRCPALFDINGGLYFYCQQAFHTKTDASKNIGLQQYILKRRSCINYVCKKLKW